MARALTPASAPKYYAELKRGVEQALLTGQRNIEQAKVRTYWETGRLIHEHILQNAARAGYGEQVITRLARDLDVARSTLYQCVLFARAFPIVRARGQLTWAHYRVLSEVPDPAKRQALALQAEKQGWTSREVEARVRIDEPADASANGHSPETPRREVELLAAKHGTPGLHLIVSRGDQLVVDLGFKLYRPLTPDQQKRFSKNTIVRIAADRITHADDATKAELFTYSATIRRVVDGDTLIVALQIAPDVVLEEKLRLRGIDCPELSTPEGKAAKRFVDALLPPGTDVILTTTKPDKYDRYLADVFVGPSRAQSLESRDGISGSQLSALSSQLSRSHSQLSSLISQPGALRPTFLNNALLENGHAVRKDAWEVSDWEKEMLA